MKYLIKDASITFLIPAMGVLIGILIAHGSHAVKSPRADILSALAKAVGKSQTDMQTVIKAAVDNNCLGEDFIILLAIWKSENGGPGFEFGIVTKRGTNLDTQARWAAASIVKCRTRWNVSDKKDFIEFMADRYPDTGSREIWLRNVRYWVNRIREELSVVLLRQGLDKSVWQTQAVFS